MSVVPSLTKDNPPLAVAAIAVAVSVVPLPLVAEAVNTPATPILLKPAWSGVKVIPVPATVTSPIPIQTVLAAPAPFSKNQQPNIVFVAEPNITVVIPVGVSRYTCSEAPLFVLVSSLVPACPA